MALTDILFIWYIQSRKIFVPILDLKWENLLLSSIGNQRAVRQLEIDYLHHRLDKIGPNTEEKQKFF